MRLFKIGVMLLALAGLVVVGCKSKEEREADQKATDEEFAKLQGKWKIESREGATSDPDGEDEEGAPKKKTELTGHYIVIEKDILIDMFGQEVDQRRKLTINHGKDPKTVDLVAVDEKGKEIQYTVRKPANKKNKASESKKSIRQVGIYKVDGDTLKISHSWNDKDRPTDFTTPKGVARYVMTLKRVKDGTEKPEKDKDKGSDKEKDKGSEKEKDKEKGKEKEKDKAN